MRFTIATIGICALLAGSADATQQTLVDTYLDLYSRTAFLPEAKKHECADLLRTELSRISGMPTVQTLRPVEVLMHDKSCLDKYSWLDPAFQPQGDARKGVSAKVIRETLYVRIESFDIGTSELFDKAIDRVPEIEMRRVLSIAIDLRGNDGGHIDELRTILDTYFSPRPGIKYLIGEFTDEWADEQITSRSGNFADIPTLLLVDRGTASAAEWMASSIRYELNPMHSMIVGETTYGKAIVQCRRVQAAGAIAVSVKVTCGEWKAAGAKVQGVGLKPDLVIETPCKDEDACISSYLVRLAR